MQNYSENSDNRSVSVVVPFYNRSRFLTRLLDSIALQSLEVEKVYIVDNGSSLEETLTAWDILKSHRIKYKCLFLSTLDKGNANFARNLGYELANTKYVAFLDSDDWWDENHLLHSVESIEKNRKVAVYSGPIINTSSSMYYGLTTDVNNFDNPFSLILNGYMAQTSSYVVNKNELKNTVVWDEQLKRHQDYDYFAKIFYMTPGWCYCRKYNSNIDWNDGGTHHKNFDFESCILFYVRWKDKIPNNVKKRYLKEMLYLSIRCRAENKIISFYKDEIIINRYFNDRKFFIQCFKPYINFKIMVKDPVYSLLMKILSDLNLKSPLKKYLTKFR